MSRIRQIKPSWWLDKELHTRVSADVREFYIGLWQIADDSGFLEWDPVRIGAELFPYAGTAKRERNVATWASALAELQPDEPHFVRWSCGHARVPKMPGHQRIAGKQTFAVRERHALCRGFSQCEPEVASTSPGRVGNGTESNGTRDLAPPDGAAVRSFRDIVGPPESMGLGPKP